MTAAETPWGEVALIVEERDRLRVDNERLREELADLTKLGSDLMDMVGAAAEKCDDAINRWEDR